MKVYKLEVMIIDFDQLGKEEIKIKLENTNFANDCIYPKVINIESRDIGKWNDSNPLNNKKTCENEFRNLFD